MAHEIKLPGGGSVLTMGSAEHATKMQRVVQARYDFSLAYAKSKGWELEQLTVDQLLEIRNQDGWKNPLLPPTE